VRYLFLILTLSCSLSCTTINASPTPIEYKTDYIDKTFNPIIESFIYEARLRGHPVSLDKMNMSFGDIRTSWTDRTVGYCARNRAGRMVIKIHSKSWKKMDEYQREELVFHEMGHCLIPREHCKAVTKDGPVSIMFPHILESTYYKKNREDLVDELFNVSPKCIGDRGSVDEIDGEVRIQAHPDAKR